MRFEFEVDATRNKVLVELTTLMGPQNSAFFTGSLTETSFELQFNAQRFAGIGSRVETTVLERVRKIRKDTEEAEIGDAQSLSTWLNAFTREGVVGLLRVMFSSASGGPRPKLFGELLPVGKRVNITVWAFPELKELAMWILLTAVSLLGIILLVKLGRGLNAEQQAFISVPALICVFIPILVGKRMLGYYSNVQISSRFLKAFCRNLTRDAALGPEPLKDIVQRTSAEAKVSERHIMLFVKWFGVALLLGAFFFYVTSFGRLLAG